MDPTKPMERLSPVLAAALLAMMITPVLESQTIHQLLLTATTGAPTRGEPFSVTLQGRTDFDLLGFSSRVTHDTARLNFVSADFSGGVFSVADFAAVDSSIPGEIGIAVVVDSDGTGPGFVVAGDPLDFTELTFRVANCTGSVTVGFGSAPDDNILVDTSVVGHDVTGTDLTSLGLVIGKNGTFVRGNAGGEAIDFDLGATASVNIADGLFILANLFTGGPEPDCLDAADVNNDGRYNIVDPIFLLQFLFNNPNVPVIPSPYDNLGPDTGTSLGCLTPPPILNCPCQTGADCDDGDPATTDTCVAGRCQNL